MLFPEGCHEHLLFHPQSPNSPTGVLAMHVGVWRILVSIQLAPAVHYLFRKTQWVAEGSL